MECVKGIYADMECLVAMWFAKAQGDTHKERLDAFYGRQAHAYDRFRANFLHGRRPMLKELAKQLAAFDGPLSWVDLGGGTGENVAMMADYIDLSRFEKIYVVDLCSPLCAVAKAKAKERGWSNVEVVEGDACTFQPDKKATVVTFSYSLSMIPPYMAAVDNALSMLAPGGLLGVADFYVSGKYDRPQRQHAYYRRWFWQAVFDLDNINLGPARRAYLDHRLDTVVELNSQGGIPYVPILRAPWYFWIGTPKDASKLEQPRQDSLQ